MLLPEDREWLSPSFTPARLQFPPMIHPDRAQISSGVSLALWFWRQGIFYGSMQEELARLKRQQYNTLRL